MKKRFVYIIIGLSSLLFSCNSNNEVKKEEETKENIQTLSHDGNTREYILYIPSSYDSNTPTSLIINYHGFGGSASDYSELVGGFYDLNSVADNENFIVAYPQGVERLKGDAEWDPGDNGSQNINENDVFFTEVLISQISEEYNIDLSRVYAVGYSNGGMMAYGLACSSSNQIAAVGIMSGIMLPETCDQSGFTSIIHFHGIDDGVLPYDGNQDFQSVGDVINFWVSHNNIPASSLVTTQLNDGDVIRDEYTNGNENTSVVLYTIKSEFGKEGGHVWFGDEIEGTSPNQILWDFLSKYSL